MSKTVAKALTCAVDNVYIRSGDNKRKVCLFFLVVLLLLFVFFVFYLTSLFLFCQIMSETLSEYEAAYPGTEFEVGNYVCGAHTLRQSRSRSASRTPSPATRRRSALFDLIMDQAAPVIAQAITLDDLPALNPVRFTEFRAPHPFASREIGEVFLEVASLMPNLSLVMMQTPQNVRLFLHELGRFADQFQHSKFLLAAEVEKLRNFVPTKGNAGFKPDVLAKIREKLLDRAAFPQLNAILQELVVSKRVARDKKLRERKLRESFFPFMALLNVLSQKITVLAVPMALYLWSNGLTDHAANTLSQFGLSSTFETMYKWREEYLQTSHLPALRRIVKNPLHAWITDNFDFFNKVDEATSFSKSKLLHFTLNLAFVRVRPPGWENLSPLRPVLRASVHDLLPDLDCRKRIAVFIRKALRIRLCELGLLDFEEELLPHQPFKSEVLVHSLKPFDSGTIVGVMKNTRFLADEEQKNRVGNLSDYSFVSYDQRMQDPPAPFVINQAADNL